MGNKTDWIEFIINFIEFLAILGVIIIGFIRLCDKIESLSVPVTTPSSVIVTYEPTLTLDGSAMEVGEYLKADVEE